jgi:hypothetical protein
MAHDRLCDGEAAEPRIEHADRRIPVDGNHQRSRAETTVVPPVRRMETWEGRSHRWAAT